MGCQFSFGGRIVKILSYINKEMCTEFSYPIFLNLKLLCQIIYYQKRIRILILGRILSSSLIEQYQFNK